MGTKKGFTLAEVLTTLMVIGIVAAMSIPALIGSTQKQELKVAFKKAVAALNQSAAMQVATEKEKSNFADAKALADYLASNLNTMSAVSSDGGFYTADGIYYKVVKGGTCSKPNFTSWSSSDNCVIAIDVNGDKGTHKVSDIGTVDGSDLNDQFYVVFTGTNVVPAANSTYKIAQNVMTGSI